MSQLKISEEQFSKMTHEQQQHYKRMLLRPYRTKNLQVGGVIIGFVGLIYGYTMYKTQQDDFKKLDE
ncbi:hypothetical protein HDV06_005419 [Boothiomyces sp. JEL0866]|nr:hypothetical protein HDV06_005419 [Boothiomyces sp. JEL0866]